MTGDEAPKNDLVVALGKSDDVSVVLSLAWENICATADGTGLGEVEAWLDDGLADGSFAQFAVAGSADSSDIEFAGDFLSKYWSCSNWSCICGDDVWCGCV